MKCKECGKDKLDVNDMDIKIWEGNNYDIKVVTVEYVCAWCKHTFVRTSSNRTERGVTHDEIDHGFAHR